MFDYHQSQFNCTHDLTGLDDLQCGNEHYSVQCRTFDKLSTLKNCKNLFTRNKNMKQLAFFTNPSPLSWKNYLLILRPYLQCESRYFHGLWYFYLRGVDSPPSSLFQGPFPFDLGEGPSSLKCKTRTHYNYYEVAMTHPWPRRLFIPKFIRQTFNLLAKTGEVGLWGSPSPH